MTHHKIKAYVESISASIKLMFLGFVIAVPSAASAGTISLKSWDMDGETRAAYVCRPSLQRAIKSR